jgi:hypothetical protein
VQILLRLRGYNYYVHQIAFEVDRNAGEKNCKLIINHGVFAKTQNGTNDGIKKTGRLTE